MAAGIAVNALGHSDQRWLDALTAQAQHLAHTSNLYHTVPQVWCRPMLVVTSTLRYHSGLAVRAWIETGSGQCVLTAAGCVTQQVELAKRLVTNSFADKVKLCR
jgi:hypothetical protein